MAIGRATSPLALAAALSGLVVALLALPAPLRCQERSNEAGA